VVEPKLGDLIEDGRPRSAFRQTPAVKRGERARKKVMRIVLNQRNHSRPSERSPAEEQSVSLQIVMLYKYIQQRLDSESHTCHFEEVRLSSISLIYFMYLCLVLDFIPSPLKLIDMLDLLHILIIRLSNCDCRA